MKGKVMVCAAAMILIGAAPSWGQAAAAASPRTNPKTAAFRAAVSPAPARTTKKTRHATERRSSSLLMPGEFDNRLWMPLARHLVADQSAIWTSPGRLRLSDANWLLPLGGLAAGLFVTDQQFSRHLSNSPTRIHRFDQLSNYGAYAMVGGTGAMYLWGLMRHDDHMREAGFLGGEALIGSLLTTEALKYSFRRSRPLDPGAGDFENGGTSFPSEHATAAWALAGMLAHEYPGPLTKILAYGLASAISVSRVEAKQHFPSDVLVGSAIGFLVAQHVFWAHHDPELGGGSWNLYSKLRGVGERRSPADMGSPYVPLGSWVYPAFERLAAMGYVQTDMLGMRPWTRLECVRLLQEAENRLGGEESEGAPRSAARIVESLENEFRNEFDELTSGTNRGVQLESLYARVTGISGKPLTDGFDFGQTLYNDSGRPYEQGVNAIVGFTGWASDGPLVGYIDGEYQHAPSGPALPQAASTFISQNQDLPPMPALPTAAVNRFDVVEGYVGLTFHNWEITAGKQNLWWSPDASGSLNLSNNAEPFNMLQIARVAPFKLPTPLLSWVGPMQVQFWIGQQGGANFLYNPSGLVGQWGQTLDPQPIIHGEKISFKPTPNLEFGFDRTTMYGGPGYPLTWHTFLRSVFSISDTPAGAPNKPGDRQSGFDMNYRLPFMRNWATFYVESYNDDEFSPIAYFDKSANSAGLYFDRLPGLPRFDLRLEGLYSNLPIGGNQYQHGYFYSDYTWRYGLRNNGNLITSWIGREGQGEQAWLTYWQTPQSYIQFQYRHEKVGADFVPGGGTINDGGVKANFWIRPDLSVSVLLQYEKWNFPVLRPGPTSDITSSVQVTFWPHWSVR
jgi:membrane-associated phospholipid phosphatase